MKDAQNKDRAKSIDLSLGGRIRKVREAKGWSIRRLAAEVGMDHPYISRLEAGIFKQPSPEKLHRLAETLDLNYDDLFVVAGYRPDDLPSLRPYLRTKYRMSDHDAQRICDYFTVLKQKHGIVENSTADANPIQAVDDNAPDSIRWENL